MTMPMSRATAATGSAADGWQESGGPFSLRRRPSNRHHQCNRQIQDDLRLTVVAAFLVWRDGRSGDENWVDHISEHRTPSAQGGS
jgi:hypothetical protein